MKYINTKYGKGFKGSSVVEKMSASLRSGLSAHKSNLYRFIFFGIVWIIQSLHFVFTSWPKLTLFSNLVI